MKKTATQVETVKDIIEQIEKKNNCTNITRQATIKSALEGSCIKGHLL